MMLRQERQRENQMLVDQASKLPNSRSLQQYIVEVAPKNRKLLRTLAVINVPNLHELSQEYGYLWGESFPKRLGDTLASITAEPWLAPYSPDIYCLSEDSYAILLHNATMQHIRNNNIAARIYSSLSETKLCPQGVLRPWFAIGVFSVLPFHTQEPARFSHAVSFVKRTTQGPIQYFASSVVRQVKHENFLRKEIDRYIRTKTAPLWLQPKICLNTGKCIGAEALLRVHPTIRQRHFPPPQIFSIATRYRLLDALEWSIVETAVAYLNHLPKQFSHLTISVNLSPTTLSKPEFGQKVCTLLHKKGISGNRLVLEVIETSRLSVNEPAVVENILTMSNYGIRLSLDDFGTGYSSLYLLSQLPFYELKIDYSMISCMEDTRVRDAIILSIESAQQYNAVVTAEGIENASQCKELTEMGIEFGQGYLFAKAIPLEEFIAYAQDKI